MIRFGQMWAELNAWGSWLRRKKCSNITYASLSQNTSLPLKLLSCCCFNISPHTSYLLTVPTLSYGCVYQNSKMGYNQDACRVVFCLEALRENLLPCFSTWQRYPHPWLIFPCKDLLLNLISNVLLPCKAFKSFETSGMDSFVRATILLL